MNTASLFWMTIFAVAALCFFIVAAVVTVRGFADMKDLLRSSKRPAKSEGDEREE